MLRKTQNTLEQIQAKILDKYGRIMPPTYRAKFEKQLRQTEVNN